jgi:hypothetical protein
MGLVYDFIAEQSRYLGNPPFEIPKMCFVNAALAVAETNSHNTYMIEEVIDEVTNGEFVKYIGNSPAVPFTHFNLDVAQRADFLAFCQHVQYLKTKGLAFVGDFQGASYHLDGSASTRSQDSQVENAYLPILRLSLLRKLPMLIVLI